MCSSGASVGLCFWRDCSIVFVIDYLVSIYTTSKARPLVVSNFDRLTASVSLQVRFTPMWRRERRQLIMFSRKSYNAMTLDTPQ